MNKFFATLHKESLLLLRDVPGLAVLFIMPVLLILVVTLAQENALKNQRNANQVLLVDNSPSRFSETLASNLDSSGMFKVVRVVNGQPVTSGIANQLLSSGSYKFCLVVKEIDSAVVIITDPTLQPTYRTAIVNSLTFLIRSTQSRFAVEDMLTANAGNMKPVIESMINKTLASLPAVEERYAAKERSAIQPNPIQNNVPGFILFAMFFIVIPLSGSIISEKNEGGYQRLMTLPVNVPTILSGKIMLYLLVCLLQFVVMMIVGCWAFPAFFGLPGLETGNSWGAIALATITAAFAAIGFGTLVGAIATTHNQAALFGSVMVVLLGIISGTFLPIHIMPPFIQAISLASPIRWGIDNYLDIFIREGTFLDILPRSLLLLAFFGFAMTISIAIFAKRKLWSSI